MISREEMVYKSKLAEQSERYEDMVDNMKKVAEMEPEMSVEERNLLSVAYKNVIGTKRASWRIITSLEQKELDKKVVDTKQVEHIRDYKKKIECELKDICTDVLKVLETIITKQDNPESKVFYCKMKGDYNRYLAEFCTSKERETVSGRSLEAYKLAQECSSALEITHPLRLGLALNFSVFYYEILNKPSDACKLAKEAFDGALSQLDQLEEEKYKDSTLIMQLLRDNLTLWTSDLTNEDQSQEEMLQDVEQEES